MTKELAYLRRATKTELELQHFFSPPIPLGDNKIHFNSGNAAEVTRYPFDYDEAKRIALGCKESGLKLMFEPRLKEWLKEETEKRKWPFKCIAQDTALGKALSERSFQREAVQFVVKNKEVLIADEPGLGKSLQAIASVIEANITGSILVVAPKTAAYVTWPHELSRWLTDAAPYDEWVIIGGKMTPLERIRAQKRLIRWDLGKGRIGPRQWVVVSPNYLRNKPKLDWRGNFIYDENGDKIIKPIREAMISLLAIDWAAIIVDECHQTLSGATGNIKDQSAQRQGLGLLSVQKEGLRIGLSGTPFRGKHENLWGTLNWLKPNEYRAYWPWVFSHFNVFQDYTGRRIISDLRDRQAFTAQTKDLMIRRTKHEVAKELPVKLYGGIPLWPKGKFNPRIGKVDPTDTGPIAVWLKMQGAQKKSYDSMAKQAMAELEGGTLMANGVLAEMTRLKQFATSHGFIGGLDEFFPTFPSNKFDWLVDFLADRGIDGRGRGESKVLVASQFTKIINLFAKHLEDKMSIPVFKLTGETNEKDRELVQREFQSDTRDSASPDIILLNTKAGGTSLTLDAADDVVILDQTFNVDDQLQIEDRAHRISRIHHVNIWYLASEGSIDESIAKNTYKMETSIKKILDGDRGMDFAKTLLTDAMG